MKDKSVIVFSALLTIGGASLTCMQAAHAGGFGPMNMMNPSKWFGGKNRRNDDYYDDYGPGGYGPYGGGYGAPPGYGYGMPPPGYAPGYGYGAPPAAGYGYTAPRYTTPSYSSPSTSSAKSSSSQTIKELENRIKRLEEGGSAAPAPSPYDKRTSSHQVPDYSQRGYGSSYSSGSYTPTYRPLEQ